jgi:glyoxylase-like metal-dependent hydrolase (beta-lactamase superfamily II)
MKRLSITRLLFAAAIVMTAPLTGFSQKTVELVPVRGDVYRFTGPLANCAMIKTPQGVLVVDSAETLDLAKSMVKAIDGCKEGDIEYLINTHWHYDHVNGNPVFAEKGAAIIAQKKVREKLETTPLQEGQPIMAKNALPEICFDSDLTIFFGGETVYIHHDDTNGAHTLGDSIVYFKNSNVLVAGDLLFIGMYPYIDPNNNGWPQGMADSLVKTAAMINDDTIVIPGHGPLTDKAGLLAFATMLKDVGDSIQLQLDEGKTTEEILAAKPTAKWDEQYGKNWMNGDTFTKLVIDCLKAHR